MSCCVVCQQILLFVSQHFFFFSRIVIFVPEPDKEKNWLWKIIFAWKCIISICTAVGVDLCRLENAKSDVNKVSYIRTMESEHETGMKRSFFSCSVADFYDYDYYCVNKKHKQRKYGHCSSCKLLIIHNISHSMVANAVRWGKERWMALQLAFSWIISSIQRTRLRVEKLVLLGVATIPDWWRMILWFFKKTDSHAATDCKHNERKYATFVFFSTLIRL